MELFGPLLLITGFVGAHLEVISIHCLYFQVGYPNDTGPISKGHNLLYKDSRQFSGGMPKSLDPLPLNVSARCKSTPG